MAGLVLTNENFDTEITNYQGLALVDFWAEWCVPCLKLAPIVADLAKEYEGRLKVGKLNVDEAGDTAARFGIKSIPTLILFKNGKIAEQVIGVQPKGNLIKLIENHVA